MAIPKSRPDRELAKFGLTQLGKTAVRVLNDTESGLYNTLSIVKTTITTTAQKINTPEDSSNFMIYHDDVNTNVYVGDETVTTTDNVYLSQKDQLEISSFELNNENKLYGIVASGTATIYAIGVINK